MQISFKWEDGRKISIVLTARSSLAEFWDMASELCSRWRSSDCRISFSGPCAKDAPLVYVDGKALGLVCDLSPGFIPPEGMVIVHIVDPDECASIDAAISMMHDQREKGIAKYGKPIEKAGCTLLELVEHARQELADGSVYLGQLANDMAGAKVEYWVGSSPAEDGWVVTDRAKALAEKARGGRVRTVFVGVVL